MRFKHLHYLSDYGNLLGSLNYDFYPFRSNSMRTTWFRNLETAAKTGQGKYNTGVTLQSMAHESSGWFDTEYHEVNEADIGFQAYSALAYGNKTLTYYTYWEHYNQSDSEQYFQSMVEYPTSEGQASVKTDLYYDVQTVNNHIKAFDHILMDYTWQGTTTINKNNSGLFSNLSSYASKRLASYSADNDAIIGHLKDSNGYDGFMLVNACDPEDNKTSKVTLKFNNATNVIYYSDGVQYDVALDGNSSYTFTLGNGKGIFAIPYVAQ